MNEHVKINYKKGRIQISMAVSDLQTSDASYFSILSVNPIGAHSQNGSFLLLHFTLFLPYSLPLPCARKKGKQKIRKGQLHRLERELFGLIKFVFTTSLLHFLSFLFSLQFLNYRLFPTAIPLY